MATYGFWKLATENPEHLAVVDSDVMAAVELPLQRDPEGSERLGPGGPVDRLGIRKYAVEIEEYGLEFGHGRRTPA